MAMRDKEFLKWLYARLINVHKEDTMLDYMHKLKSIIESTDSDKTTPNTK